MLTLLRAPDESVRHATVKALIDLRDTECVQPHHTQVIAGLLGDSSEEIRRTALLALGSVGTQVGPYAEEMAQLLGDGDLGVRDAAVSAFSIACGDGPCPGPLAIHAVLAMLRHHNPEARESAVEALGNMGDHVERAQVA